MSTFGERLRQAREKAGFKTAADAARAMGIKYPTYAGHDNGTTVPPREAIKRYAEFYRVSPGWLLTGKGLPLGRRKDVPVRGYVGAGDQVYVAVEGLGDRIDTVPVPDFMQDQAEAVIVRGDSMWPFFDDGDMIFYDERSTEFLSLVKRKVVAMLADDRLVVKVLRRGSRPGHWTLDSFNGPPMEDVRLQWAARIKHIVPR